jgi:hypothetical protein
MNKSDVKKLFKNMGDKIDNQSSNNNNNLLSNIYQLK